MIRLIFRTLATLPERYGYVTIRDTTGQSYLVPYSASVLNLDDTLTKLIGDMPAKDYNRSLSRLEADFNSKYGDKDNNVKLYPAEPLHRQLD
jgi:hypothetical protein